MTDDHYNQHVYMKDKDVNESQFIYILHNPQIHTLTEMLSIHFQLRLFIGITITVLLMTYLIMPLLTKLLRPWLFKISK